MKTKPQQAYDPVEGFIPLEEFPVSEDFRKEVLRLTELAKSGDGFGNDEEYYLELLIDYDRRTAFPTEEEIKRLSPSQPAARANHKKPISGQSR